MSWNDLAELAAEVVQLQASQLHPVPAPSLQRPHDLRVWLQECAQLLRDDWQSSRADRLEQLASLVS